MCTEMEGSGALPSSPTKFMVTVPDVERLGLDTTPRKKTEGWHQGGGTGRAQGLRASSGTQWPWVPRFRCGEEGTVFILCLHRVWEHRVRTGFLGKLVLQEEWQELRSPLLPQHQQQKCSFSAAQSKLCPSTGSRKTCLFPPAFQRNKGHFAAWQALLPHCPPRVEPRAAVPGWLPKQGAAELRQPGVCIFQVPDSLIAPESFSYGPSSWP